MKKAARFLALLLIAIIMVSGVTPAFADSADNEAPVIHGVTIENHTANKTYGPNDKLKVKISVTDNISIGAIFVYVTNVQTGEEFIRDLQQPVVADKYTIEFSFESYVSGDYYITQVSVCDSAHNYTHEFFTTEDSYYCFSVNNPTYNPTAPNVKSLKVTPDNGHSKKTEFTYTAVIEATGSEKITRVTVDVGQMMGQTSVVNCIDLESTGKKNEYSATVTFKDRFTSSVKYPEVFKLDVNTEDGRAYYFFPEDTTTDWATLFLDGITRKDLTVNLTDIVEDKEPPKLLGFRYVSSEIYTPDTLKLVVDATDNLGGVNVLNVFFGKEGDPNYKVGIPGVGYSQNQLEIGFEFPKYCGNGTFYIKEISLVDTSGNVGYYYLDNGDFEKKTFTVHDTAAADYYTSVTAPDFLDVITKAADEKGKTVVINISRNNPTIPKAVFEIIAGKDVTVIFEKMYDYSSSGGESDDGIEWVMYGKHVDQAKAKDINAYINIKQEDWRNITEHGKFKKPSREKGNAFIRIIFANNGELPGKATIRFKPGFTLRGFTNAEDMRLYYLNEETSEVDLVGSNIKTEKTGYFHFNITHNSSYAFVGDYDEQADSGNGGNGGSGSGNGNGGDNGSSDPDGGGSESGEQNGENAEDGKNSDTASTNSSASNTDSEKGGNALTVILISLGAVLVIGGGAFGFFYYKKKTAKNEADSESQTE